MNYQKLADRMECIRREIRDAPNTEVQAELLGEYVRLIWMDWAIRQPNCQESWLIPWNELSEEYREVDRLIGVGVYNL